MADVNDRINELITQYENDKKVALSYEQKELVKYGYISGLLDMSPKPPFQVKAILDIEMPECCADCDYECALSLDEGNSVHWECILTGEALEVDETRLKRHDKCPLAKELQFS